MQKSTIYPLEVGVQTHDTPWEREIDKAWQVMGPSVSKQLVHQRIDVPALVPIFAKLVLTPDFRIQLAGDEMHLRTSTDDRGSRAEESNSSRGWR
jgi:hypothetical protein